MKRTIFTIIATLLVLIIGISLWSIFKIQSEYSVEDEFNDEMMIYKPSASQGALIIDSTASQNGNSNSEEAVENISLGEAKKTNSDVVGWLTVPNTKIDYLFVQSGDNDYYLHRNLKKNYAAAGTLFMDYRNSKSFEDFNTIIYGHHMKSGSMFGTLVKFKEKAFFNDNNMAYLYLPDKNYELEIFAYLVIRPDDAKIYNFQFSGEQKSEYFNYIKNNAIQYREIGLNENDKIVVLSTCSYEFEDARAVLLTRLK